MASNRTRYGIRSTGLGWMMSRNRRRIKLAASGTLIAMYRGGGVDMKSNYFKKIAGTAVMAFSLILGISSIAAAQYPDPYQNDRYRRQQDEQYRRQQAEQDRRDQEDRWRRDQNDQGDRRRNQDPWGRDRWGRGRGWDGY